MTANGLDRDRLVRAGGVLLVCFVLLKLALMGWLALRSAYVMDEYANAGSALGLHELYQAGAPLKTVLSSFFYRLAHALGDDSAAVMSAARALTAGVAVLLAGTVYLVSRHLGNATLASLFNVAVLLAFSTFMERAFRVRSEPLAVLFAMLALAFLTHPALERRTRQAAAGGVLAALAFLTTQKAVYFSVALGLGLASGFVFERERRATASAILAFCGAWAATAVAYAVYFKGTRFTDVLGQVVARPARYALQGGGDYADLHLFVWQTLARNAELYALCAAGLAIALAAFRRRPANVRLAGVATLVTTVLVFAHSQPWPYVFVMALPMLCLWAATAPSSMAQRWPRTALPIAAVMALVLAASLPRNVAYLKHWNGYQNAVARLAEGLLAPAERYVDGVGMLVTRQQAGSPWWDARELRKFARRLQRGDAAPFDRIMVEMPKIWILNYRVQALWPLLEPRLVRSYVTPWPNLLVSGAIVPPEGETIFHNVWPGGYRLYHLNGRPARTGVWLDGNRAAGPMRLGTGIHRLARDQKGPHLLLLPEGMPAPFAPSDRLLNYRPLFESTYTY